MKIETSPPSHLAMRPSLLLAICAAVLGLLLGLSGLSIHHMLRTDFGHAAPNGRIALMTLALAPTATLGPAMFVANYGALPNCGGCGCDGGFLFY